MPHHVLIVRGDNDWYIIDPLKDLMNNQVGLQPNFYAIEPKLFNIRENFSCLKISTLSPDYVKEIDDTLKLYKNGIYLDDIFGILHNELSTNKAYSYLSDYIDRDINCRNRELFYRAKMQFINDYLINISYIPGKIERSRYYSYMLGKVCNHSERKFSIVRCPSNLPIVVIFNSKGYLEDVKDEGRYFFRAADSLESDIIDSILSDSSISSVKAYIKNRNKRHN